MYFLGVMPKRVNEYFCTVKLVINFETLIKCAKNYAQRVNEILILRIIGILGFWGRRWCCLNIFDFLTSDKNTLGFLTSGNVFFTCEKIRIFVD